MADTGRLIKLTAPAPGFSPVTLLRVAIIAELDAINLYEQLAALTDNADIKKVFLDIAKEEKTHVGEFQTMLLRMDAEQVQEMEAAKKEIKELTGK